MTTQKIVIGSKVKAPSKFMDNRGKIVEGIVSQVRDEENFKSVTIKLENGSMDLYNEEVNSIELV